MFNPKQPIKRGDIVRVVGDSHKKIVWTLAAAFTKPHTAEVGRNYRVDDVQGDARVLLIPRGSEGGPLKVCGTMDLELVTPKA